MIFSATITGRRHHLRRQNGQDAAFGANVRPNLRYGLVLDGCGSKVDTPHGGQNPHNEVGAHLLGRFLAQYLQTHLPGMEPENAPELLAGLHDAAILFFRSLLGQYPFATTNEADHFIFGNLLTTAVGFISWEDSALFFWRGDGFLLLDNEVILCDANNQPDYLAYDCLDSGSSPGGFHLLSPRTPPQRLAVATDGWQADQLAALPPLSTNLQLERLLNQQARDRRFFTDDGAIVLWQKPEVHS